MSESSGKSAASVLPPAVGATSTQSSPDRTGSTAAACSGRRPRHMSELTMWYSVAESSPAVVLTGASREIELDVVDAGGAAPDVTQRRCRAPAHGQVRSTGLQVVSAARVD